MTIDLQTADLEPRQMIAVIDRRRSQLGRLMQAPGDPTALSKSELMDVLTILEFESEFTERLEPFSQNFFEHEDYAATKLWKKVEAVMKRFSDEDFDARSAIHSATVRGRKLASWLRIGKNREFSAEWSAIFYDDQVAEHVKASEKDSLPVLC
jgi:hypothetical protein